jgi:hypothetical protein
MQVGSGVRCIAADVGVFSKRLRRSALADHRSDRDAEPIGDGRMRVDRELLRGDHREDFQGRCARRVASSASSPPRGAGGCLKGARQLVQLGEPAGEPLAAGGQHLLGHAVLGQHRRVCSAVRADRGRGVRCARYLAPLLRPHSDHRLRLRASSRIHAGIQSPQPGCRGLKNPENGRAHVLSMYLPTAPWHPLRDEDLLWTGNASLHAKDRSSLPQRKSSKIESGRWASAITEPRGLAGGGRR